MTCNCIKQYSNPSIFAYSPSKYIQDKDAPCFHIEASIETPIARTEWCSLMQNAVFYFIFCAAREREEARITCAQNNSNNSSSAPYFLIIM